MSIPETKAAKTEQGTTPGKPRLFVFAIGRSIVEWCFLALFVALLYLAIIESTRDDPDIVTLNMLVLALIAQLATAGFVLSRRKPLPWIVKEFTDLRHEFTGALIVASLLLFLVTIPGEQKAENQLKEQLIREMGSYNNGIALRAVRELRANGWLSDGSLIGAYLWGANLQGADLWGANLQKVELGGANLQGVDLQGANLQGADLWVTDLNGANLRVANLQGADLWGANLRGVDILGTQFNEATTLPDGTKWTPDADKRFIDPDRSDFWRSDDPRSPAFRDNGE